MAIEIVKSGVPRPLANYNEAFVVGDLVFAASQLASNFKRGVPVEARKRIVSSITARTSSCRRSTFWRT